MGEKSVEVFFLSDKTIPSGGWSQRQKITVRKKKTEKRRSENFVKRLVSRGQSVIRKFGFTEVWVFGQWKWGREGVSGKGRWKLENFLHSAAPAADRLLLGGTRARIRLVGFCHRFLGLKEYTLGLLLRCQTDARRRLHCCGLIAVLVWLIIWSFDCDTFSGLSTRECVCADCIATSYRY